MENCIFCKIVKGEIKADVVRKSDNFMVIRDANPKVSGHSLVIPKEHFTNLFDLSDSLYEEFLRITKDAAVDLTFENNTSDFNLVLNNGKNAGQIINHLHLHILPRKEGEGNVHGNHLSIV